MDANNLTTGEWSEYSELFVLVQKWLSNELPYNWQSKWLIIRF